MAEDSEKSQARLFWWEPLGLVVALALFAGLLHYLGPATVDDTYISLRYARNVLTGEGLTWNPGQPPVEGYTSLLWLLVLCAGSLGNADQLAECAVHLSIFFGALVILGSWVIARFQLRARASLAILLPLHLGAAPFLARHAASGMETTFACCGILLHTSLALFTASRPRPILAALLGVSTVVQGMIRPDAMIYAGPLSLAVLIPGLYASQRHRLFPVLATYCACGAVALLVYLAWKLFHFGHLVPIPAVWKTSALEAWKYPTFMLGHYASYATAIALPVVIVILQIARSPRETTPAQTALIIAVFCFSLYFLTVLPVMSYQFRYLYPMYPIVFLLGISFADRLLARRLNPAAWAALAVVYTFCNTGWVSPTADTIPFQRDRYALYGELGRQLRGFNHLSIALTEAGQLAYYSEAEIIDVLGLNNRHVAENRTRGAEFAPDFWRYLDQETGFPDLYIVSTPEASWALVENQPRLRDVYTIVREHPILVAVKRDSPYRGELVRITESIPLY